MSGDEFLELHKQGMDTLGFWTEEYRSILLRTIENKYKSEIIREWFVSDFIANADKFLIKWVKRHKPLSDEEMAELYGR